MVTRIVSRFTGPPLPSPNGERRIKGGPLYPPEEVLALLAHSGAAAVHVWTRDCIRDTQKLALDGEGLAALLAEALQQGRFIGAQWCVQKPDGPWAACDAWSLTRHEWIAAAGREMQADYYLKFAIGRTGALLLLVSCHLSGS